MPHRYDFLFEPTENEKVAEEAVRKQLEFLGISAGSYCYEPVRPSQEALDICETIDKEHTGYPAKGVRQMRI